MSGLGVPVKLLHESLGHIITVELKTGQLYRGKLAEGTHTKPSSSYIPKETDQTNILYDPFETKKNSRG